MPAANGPTWTDDRVTALKQLWAKGLSCSRIAKELGGVTRNAVIGKACRLGLPSRNPQVAYRNWLETEGPRPSSAPSKPRKIPAKERPLPPETAKKAKSKPPKPAKAAVAATNGNVVPLTPRARRPPPSPSAPLAGEPLHLTLVDLKTGHCRWPLGDGPFTFCGCATVDPQDPTDPYCAHHAWKARRRDTGSKFVPGLIRPDFKRNKPGKSAMFRQAAGKAARG